MARLKAFALRTEAARISSSPQKSADFRGPRKRCRNGSPISVRPANGSGSHFLLSPKIDRFSGTPKRLCVTMSEKAQAQMAESVDALVSNTSGAIRAGSTPALGTASEMARRSAFAWRTEAAHISSFPQKTLTSFLGAPMGSCGEVRPLGGRRRLALAPFPQNLLQSFWGYRWGKGKK